MAKGTIEVQTGPAGSTTTTVQFHYIKSPGYRETSVHGAIGGVTPQNLIWMSPYTERHPIPRTVSFEVPSPAGSHTVSFNERELKPDYVEARQGIIRNIETTIYLDVDIAERLYDWLGDRINELKKRQAEE